MTLLKCRTLSFVNDLYYGTQMPPWYILSDPNSNQNSLGRVAVAVMFIVVKNIDQDHPDRD